MGLGVIADSILIASCCTDQLHDWNRSYSPEYDSHACDRVIIDNTESLSALVISLSCHIMVLTHHQHRHLILTFGHCCYLGAVHML